MISKRDAFVFIHTHKHEYSVIGLADLLNVSTSGYYDWVKRGGVYTQEYRDEEIYQYIHCVFKQAKGTIGRRRVKLAIQDQFGIKINQKRIARIMRNYGLKCQIRKRFRKYTEEPRYVKNILERQFKAIKPGKKFCMDITYIKVYRPVERWAYLCAITDLYNNEIVAYTFGPSLELKLVYNTVDQLKEKGFEKNAILHTDQGIQFTNPQYLARVRKMRLIPSMSRRGNCWDNACIESFFSHFKTEIKHFGNPETFKQTSNLIDHYIDYYNTVRVQEKLGTTPKKYQNKAA
ncbi:IS3 family transposase [Piscibacillus sp. B03]|uniref:IS3 family transposase n=1 Tax=Piscibacillus sp. B03 TaxID=3457430 RepID=UPI003FCDF1A1